jgi:hypothetical protein
MKEEIKGITALTSQPFTMEKFQPIGAMTSLSQDRLPTEMNRTA